MDQFPTARCVQCNSQFRYATAWTVMKCAGCGGILAWTAEAIEAARAELAKREAAAR